MARRGARILLVYRVVLNMHMVLLALGEKKLSAQLILVEEVLESGYIV